MKYMDFQEEHKKLSGLYKENQSNISIPGENIEIKNCRFTSYKNDLLENIYNTSELEKKISHSNVDSEIQENNTFTYPIFFNHNQNDKRIILLLHGLNEKSWSKYLPWAYYLTKKTGRHVVLFPISFHINRAPKEWSEPRRMMAFSKKRQRKFKNIKKSSYVNVALSERLTRSPQRFVSAGYQSAGDLIQLMRSIKNGTHPEFSSAKDIDILAYSIGAFLTQILLLSNPEGILNRSKIALFCGGTELSQMNGTSRFIMDNIAQQRIYDYYTKEFENAIKNNNTFSRVLNNKLGLAFRAMLTPNKFKNLKINVLKKFSDQLKEFALLKDKIVPLANIRQTFNQNGKVHIPLDVFDFSFPYSHEIPFPVNDTKLQRKASEAFNQVFSDISNFMLA